MHSSGNGDLTDRTEPSHPDIVEKAIALADAIVSSAGGEFSASIAPLLDRGSLSCASRDRNQRERQ